MSKNTETPEGEYPSAENVQQRFLLDLNGAELGFNQVKCPNCKIVTPHQWVPVQVTDSHGTSDPLELLSLAKRLILCQNCGSMRLVK